MGRYIFTLCCVCCYRLNQVIVVFVSFLVMFAKSSSRLRHISAELFCCIWRGRGQKKNGYCGVLISQKQCELSLSDEKICYILTYKIKQKEVVSISPIQQPPCGLPQFDVCVLFSHRLYFFLQVSKCTQSRYVLSL